MGVVVLGALLAARPAAADDAEPAVAVERLALLRTAAETADLRLEALIAELQRAVDAGRRGSALTVEGDKPPATEFEAAADAAARAAVMAIVVGQTTASLDGTLAAVAPAFGSLPDGPRAVALEGSGLQLTRAAQASGSFVNRRHSADDTLAALADALAALDDDDPIAALAALDRADAARAEVAAWEQPPSVLPYWLDTTGGMLHAARRIAEATIDGDGVAAAGAGRAYRRAAEKARRADTALALAITESGSALASVPLHGLADALATATAQRDAVTSVLQMVP
ncbi:MAG TPA: hypothetical protein VES36_03375 [Candidatus Limnocylindrales bacterium]|nr:hypothetical protein [Candidatus Limnocylindrales bacterium]